MVLYTVSCQLQAEVCPRPTDGPQQSVALRARRQGVLPTFEQTAGGRGREDAAPCSAR